jgi:hypothetical protein
MSKEALAKVVQRAISDAAFRRQLNSDPAGALRGFDLSSDEMSAIRTGDAGRLTTLGVDQRMSKAYTLGTSFASRNAASDLTPGGGPAMVDDASGASAKTSFPGDPTRPGGSADVDGGTSGTSTVRVGDDYKFAGRQAPDSGGSSTVRVGDDYKFAGGRVAPDSTGTVRTGDDWKFADRSASQGSAAPVEGSPEASAAENASAGSSTARIGDDWKFADRAVSQGSAAPVEGSPEADAAQQGTGMAAYPAHDGLAGPSAAQSVRAGDDWARNSAAAADSGRIGTARLDDASAGASGGATAIHDDPNGFLAANATDTSGAAARANVIHDDPNGFLAANADAGGSVVRANVIHDDPNGFLAANADAGGAAARANVIHDDPNGFLAANADAGGAAARANVIHDDPNGFLAANADAGGAAARANVIHDDPNGFLAANADAAATGGSAGDGTAFLDESEAYLTKVGYDASAASTPNADATWSGEEIAGPSSVTDDTADGGQTSTEGGPNITP